MTSSAWSSIDFDRPFIVAAAMPAALLSELRNQIDLALERGDSFDALRTAVLPLFERTWEDRKEPE